MSILVITTGGTIGALPYADPSNAPEVSEFSKDYDFVKDLLSTPLLHKIDTVYEPLEPRDSKMIDTAYRERLADIAAVSESDEILITHGTDAILQTAEFLYGRMQENETFKDKIIVLTGAMTPLSNGVESDGFGNLAFALEWLNEISAFPENRKRPLAGIHIVLSDYDNPDKAEGHWQPRRYEFAPGRFEKLYAQDNRFNRIRQRSAGQKE